MSPNKKYFKWFIKWYKQQIVNDINDEASAVIMLHLPNELSPEFMERDDNTFSIECFIGKKAEPKYMENLLTEMCQKADELSIKLYLDKTPRKNPVPDYIFQKNGFLDFNETYYIRTPKN